MNKLIVTKNVSSLLIPNILATKILHHKKYNLKKKLEKISYKNLCCKEFIFWWKFTSWIIIYDKNFSITLNYIFIKKLNSVSKIFLMMNLSSKIIPLLVI